MTGRRRAPLAVRARRVLAFLAAAAVAGVAHAHMDAASAASSGESFVPNPRRARLASLGFTPLVSDYYWLRAVQLVGGTEGAPEENEADIARLVDVATTVDPWIDHAYRFAAIWLTGSEDSIHRANHLLERGVAYHPKEWRNRYYLGFNLFFYLEDNARAAEVLEPAVALDGSPTYLGALVARLRADGGGLEMAAGFLAEMARTTEDPYAEAEYLKALDEIQTERVARFLDEARIEYWRRHGRDIESVHDLVNGPDPVLSALPPGHPHVPGFSWRLDAASDQIVSTYYRNRYRLHVHPMDEERRARWRALRGSRAPEES